MKNKDIYKNRTRFLLEAEEIMSNKDFILFAFGDKNGLSLNLKGYKKIEKKIIMDILLSVIHRIYKKKMYAGFGGNSLIIGKSSFSIFDAKDKEYDYKLGKFLSIPKCCAKKFQEEKNKKSEKSALRYLNQCKKLKIKKDLFNVYLSTNAGSCNLGYGFIPCHPLCKNALKIDKNYKKVMEKLK